MTPSQTDRNTTQWPLWTANLVYAIVALSLLLYSAAPLAAFFANMDFPASLRYLMSCVAEILLILLPLTLLVCRQSGALKMLRIARLPWRAAALSVLLAPLAYICASVLSLLWALLLTALGVPVSTGLFIADIADGSTWIILLLALVLAPAFCEELLFRGVILGAYAPYGVVRSVMISAALFTALHGSIANWPFLLLTGAVMGLLVLRTGSVWSAVLFHLASNGCAFLLGILRPFIARRAGLIELYDSLSGTFDKPSDVLTPLVALVPSFIAAAALFIGLCMLLLRYTKDIEPPTAPAVGRRMSARSRLALILGLTFALLRLLGGSIPLFL